MIRKLAYAAGAIIVLGAAAFWILTTPQGWTKSCWLP